MQGNKQLRNSKSEARGIGHSNFTFKPQLSDMTKELAKKKKEVEIKHFQARMASFKEEA